jgi:hypothetical protein
MTESGYLHTDNYGISQLPINRLMSLEDVHHIIQSAFPNSSVGPISNLHKHFIVPLTTVQVDNVIKHNLTSQSLSNVLKHTIP